MEKVEVYVEISGDYCAFHEMMFSVIYDVTNDIQMGDYTLEELRNWERDDYNDCELRSAVIVDDTYYVEW